MRCVLTGGPGIGKTTVVELLASWGYSVTPESARMIIEEQKANGGNIFPWTDLHQFQGKVAERQLKLEANITDTHTFLDRGLVDGYGYCMFGGIAAPPAVIRQGHARYDKIFVLEPLPAYGNDGSRLEKRTEARKIHQFVIDAYTHFEYEITFVPVMPPDDRARYILAAAGLS